MFNQGPVRAGHYIAGEMDTILTALRETQSAAT